MSLSEVLASSVDNLHSGKLEEEAHVKAAVITPILEALGWDPKALELWQEYSVDSGKVDYALLSEQRPLVFVEAKRLGNLSPKAEEQLFSYASNEGIPLLILTDGDIWDFYLSMAAGKPTDRRFHRIELRTYSTNYKFQDSVAPAEDLLKFLSKHQVVSGKAQKSAEELHNDNQLRQKSKRALPQAWENMLNDPDSLLIELLAEEANTVSGNKPRSEDVFEFLKQIKKSTVSSNSKQQDSKLIQVPQREGKVKTKTTLNKFKPAGSKRSNFKILGYQIYSQKVKCHNGVATMVAILNDLELRNPGFLDRLYQNPRNKTKNRRIVSQNRHELFLNSPPLESDCKTLINGWWVGGNISAETIRRRVELFCEVAGLKYGSDLTLIEE